MRDGKQIWLLTAFFRLTVGNGLEVLQAVGAGLISVRGVGSRRKSGMAGKGKTKTSVQNSRTPMPSEKA
ncbi:MAG: hypothetical protein KKE51_05480 [Gammaproteobacteria bacterium]|nr:hypothetical protein [Gammaproteobacteria bacterium]MBU2435674.1 hypothetical protein [Gammaproteobacteria bacterium]MBU2449545.1 hypothetical protein [Gammaproteobacteria bacterium]